MKIQMRDNKKQHAETDAIYGDNLTKMPSTCNY